jgi:hypothetical protein
MNFPILKRLPCSVCGLVALRHEGWFLVLENRWLDRLKILTWHATLARQGYVRSACSREHLKLLMAYWLEESSLRLASPACRVPSPLAGIPESAVPEIDPKTMGCFIAELSVCREPMSRGWAGSPESLECILEALVPPQGEKRAPARAVRLFEPRPEPFTRLALH